MSTYLSVHLSIYILNTILGKKFQLLTKLQFEKQYHDLIKWQHTLVKLSHLLRSARPALGI